MPLTAGSDPRTSANLSTPSSNSSTCCGVAPFCGPKTAAAPLGPRRGFVTSVRSRTPPGGGETRSWASIHASLRSAPPPSGSGRPASSNSPSPRAASAPVPPSVVAEPPSATVMELAPAFRAILINSPTPLVVAFTGSSVSINGRPAACASSMTASPVGSMSQSAARCRP